jgi:hypothetical protein
MVRSGLVCISLMMALTCGSNAEAQEGQAQQEVSGTGAPSDAASKSEATQTAPDAPVIIIPGICATPATGTSKEADCRTVVTRAEFEAMIDLLQPGASPAGRKFFARSQAKALINAVHAQNMGLDKTANFDLLMAVRHMNFERMELQEKFDTEEWNKVTDKDIEAYYRDNPAEFEQLDVDRIFIPKMPRAQDSDPKLSEADQQKRKQAWFDQLKQDAEKLRVRALDGESFLQLQREAYRFAGLRGSDVDASGITLTSVRRIMFSEGQRSIMSVQTGDISPVLEDENGYFVFRVVARSMLPLEKARKEIHDTLRKERVKHDWNALFNSVQTTFNEDYFGPETEADRQTIRDTRPGARP